MEVPQKILSFDPREEITTSNRYPHSYFHSSNSEDIKTTYMSIIKTGVESVDGRRKDSICMQQ